MGLLDFFRKKTEQAAFDLEELLRRSAHDPAYRAEFYRVLTGSDLIVLTGDTEMPEGVHTMEKDSTLNIVTFPDGRIPIFTSTDRIFDKGVVKEEVQYAAMNAKDLFITCRGATLILNPYSDYGKELPSEEIEKLLDGTILSAAGKSITIQEATEVMLGQPASVPHEMLAALNTVFARHPQVKRAYLGWIATRVNDEPPHYIIGIETSEYSRDLVNDAGFTAQQFLGPQEFVDFVDMSLRTGISDYLRSTQAFYAR